VKLLGPPCKKLRGMMEQPVLVIQHVELEEEYIFEGVSINVDALEDYIH